MPIRKADPCEPVVRATYIPVISHRPHSASLGCAVQLTLPAVTRAGVQENGAGKLLFLEEARHRAALAKRTLRSVRCRAASCGALNVFNPAAEAGPLTACLSCARPLLSEVK